ncbi:hypothetical protein ACFXKR_32905 [Streptomyces violascens]|uniref:hypothetical protein n=1 Tax=Streptomyces violascens TaxID=67381 RepID=UPI00368BB832
MFVREAPHLVGQVPPAEPAEPTAPAEPAEPGGAPSGASTPPPLPHGSRSLPDAGPFHAGANPRPRPHRTPPPPPP